MIFPPFCICESIKNYNASYLCCAGFSLSFNKVLMSPIRGHCLVGATISVQICPIYSMSDTFSCRQTTKRETWKSGTHIESNNKIFWAVICATINKISLIHCSSMISRKKKKLGTFSPTLYYCLIHLETSAFSRLFVLLSPSRAKGWPDTKASAPTPNYSETIGYRIKQSAASAEIVDKQSDLYPYILKASSATPTEPQKFWTFRKFVQKCHKMTQKGPKWPKYDPKWPKMPQKWPQMAQSVPNMTQNGPRMTQNNPKRTKKDPHFFRNFFLLKRQFRKLFRF